MRFSSDQEIFDNENSNQQPSHHSQDPKHTPVKKQKKQTLLSKFLDSLDPHTIKQLQIYQKHNKPVFERRPNVPQKITLYEDVLFILAFKDQRDKANPDGKQIKDICNDLESRTKRKECTIKERMQKKLCKMTPEELLSHVAKNKDISFNLKKVLTSGAKIEHQKSSQKNNQNQHSSKKQDSPENQQKIEMQQQPKTQLHLKEADSKKQEIFEEKDEQQEKIQQEKTPEQIQNPSDQIDENDIFIIFKKEPVGGAIFMINRMIVEREIMELKKKEEEAKKREELIKQLKTQMDIIMQFRNKFSTIPHEVQMLIDEAHQIMKKLDISSMDELQQNEKHSQIKGQQSPIKITETSPEKTQTESPASQKEQTVHQIKVAEFEMTEDNNTSDKAKVPENDNTAEKPSKSYSIEFALCQNSDYINLYNSNPDIFEPLLWTEEEDMLIDKLIEDFKSNEGLFNLLVRYKGPEMLVDRCVFQKKAVGESKLMEAIKNSKPLNLGKLNNFLTEMNV